IVLGVPGYAIIAVTTCVLLTLYQGLPRSFGFLNHAQLALLYAAYVLAAFPCADALAIAPARARRERAPVLYRAPMLAAALACVRPPRADFLFRSDCRCWSIRCCVWRLSWAIPSSPFSSFSPRRAFSRVGSAQRGLPSSCHFTSEPGC